jgi:acyl-CoA synthetase (AMP-forming)/AMP-acid ligase II
LDAGPSLRHIFIGGEALEGRLLTELGAVTDAAVHHLYGCTETAIDATFLAYARAGQHLAPPIGRAIANVETVIVDQNTRPLVPGAAGELCISGMALARGYLHRPDLTGARFIVEPNSGVRFYRTGDLARLRPDGNLEILGRVDRQIKLRGVRIEPGEIEVCLRSHPEVAHAIVARRDVDGEAALVAWIEPRAGRTLSGADLPTYLARQLPRFMLPQQYVMVDALPLTPSGKIDIEKLPTPPSPAPVIEQSSPEATALEQRIAQVWGQVLGRTQIGLHDDFFQIGGHSLLAVGLAARLSTALSRTVSVSTVLASPTVSELARAIAEN